MPGVSIVTPWLSGKNFLAGYEAAVEGAEVIVIDNGNEADLSAELAMMCQRLGGTCIHNVKNNYFSGANNQGLALATRDVVLFLNNDIEAQPGWLEQVERDVTGGALVGPTVRAQIVDGMLCPYVEGWCVAATRDDWRMLGGWDAENFPLPYWEDTYNGFKARTMGLGLHRCNWPVRHLGGDSTGKLHPEVYAGADANRETYFRLVRKWKKENGYASDFLSLREAA